MTSRNKSIILVLSAALLAGAGVWLWRANSDGATLSQLRLTSLFGGSEKNKLQQVSTNFKEYYNSDLGFSFQYPEGFLQTEFEDENGTVILFEASGRGFQIFVSPFDESGPLTAERIKKDLPNLVMENPTLTKVAGEDSLSFIGSGGEFKTAEVWFVWPPEPYPNGNYFYQITSSAEFDEELSKIMATWKFQ